MANAAITVDLNARIAQFETELKRATGSLDKFAARGNAAMSTFRSLGGALAGAFSVAAIGGMVKSTIDFADALNDMSKRTGVAVKDLASLKLVAEQNGSSLDAMALGLSKLNLSVGQAQGGSKEMAEALQRLGISSGDARERLFQLADAYAKAGGNTRVLADIQKVLGRGYAEMLPVLAQSGTELRKSAEASESFADAMARLAPNADKFNDQLADMKQTSALVAANILNKLVPSLTEYVKAIDDVIERGSLLDKIKFFGAGFMSQDTLDRVREAGKRVQDYNEQIFKLQQAQIFFKRSGDTGAAERIQGQINDLEERRAGLIALVRAQEAAATNQTKQPDLEIRVPGKKRQSEYFDVLVSGWEEAAKELEQYAETRAKLASDEAALAEFDAERLRIIRDEQKEYGDALEDTRKSLQDMIDPTAKWIRELDKLDRLETLGLDTNLIAAARLEIHAQIDAVNGLGEAAKKTKTFGEEMGLAFSSAFEDAMVAGAKFSDVLKGLAQDIQRIILRKTLTEPYGGKIASFIGDLFPFASGGIMTSSGPLQLNRYATGGVIDRPQLYIAGEGGMNEAIVPLPDGRAIPVQFKGGGGGGLHQTINIDARGADAGVESRIRQAVAEAAKLGYSMVVNDLTRGGTVARLTGAA